MAPRSNAGSKRHSRMKCIYSGCPNKAGVKLNGEDETRKGPLCFKHQCLFMENNELCTSSKRPEDEYCYYHSKCTVRHCLEKRKQDKNDNLFEYCDRHNCTVPHCIDQRKMDNNDEDIFLYCNRHNCIVPDCLERTCLDEAGIAYQEFCTAHLFRICGKPSCHELKLGGGKFCRGHTCQIPACYNSIAVDGGVLCGQHNKCERSECINSKQRNGNKYEKFCQSHLNTKCEDGNCHRKRSSESRFCDLHACRERACGNRKDSSDYCINHKCLKNGCCAPRTSVIKDNEVTHINDYCYLHECRKVGCFKSNKNPHGQQYCIDHSCTETGCSKERESDSRFGTLCWGCYMNNLGRETEHFDFQLPRDIPQNRRMPRDEPFQRGDHDYRSGYDDHSRDEQSPRFRSYHRPWARRDDYYYHDEYEYSPRVRYAFPAHSYGQGTHDFRGTGGGAGGYNQSRGYNNRGGPEWV